MARIFKVNIPNIHSKSLKNLACLQTGLSAEKYYITPNKSRFLSYFSKSLNAIGNSKCIMRVSHSKIREFNG